MTMQNTTGMAGEFAVMSQLYRIGLQPALTLGNAKSVDILLQTPSGTNISVEVKTSKGGGKFALGKWDTEIDRSNQVFVLVYYKSFDDLGEPPVFYIMPGEIVGNHRNREDWHNVSALYYYKEKHGGLEAYKEYMNRWDTILNW
jgi:hypothetical protein